MSFDQSQTNFRKLLKIITAGEKRIIPFVGAGLSIYGKGEEALPQWSELIDLLVKRAFEHRLLKKGSEVHQKIDRLIVEGKLITATDLIVNEILGVPTFRKTIQEALDIEGKQVPPAMMELVGIAWSTLITTNLDNFIEKAWALKHGSPISVLTNSDATDINSSLSGHSAKPTLLKTHGTLERFETWVLSKSHYDAVLNDNPAYVEALKLLYRQTLFFVGFGLSDRDFEPLLEQLTRIYPGGVGDFYALIPEHKSENYTPLMRKYGLQPIWFKVDPSRKNESDGGYGEVKECLSLMASAWLTSSTNVPVILKYFPEFEKSFQGRSIELNELSKFIFENQKSMIQIVGFGGEGKTSLVQKWVLNSKDDIIKEGYDLVFGCSFYKADIGRFIDGLYNQLAQDGQDFDIASKVSRIIGILDKIKIILILDGFEIVQSESGIVRNSYLKDIIEAVSASSSVAIVTTRVKIPLGFHTMSLGGLNFSDIAQIFESWGIEVSNSEDKDLIKKHIGSHALSVRIMASYLKSSKRKRISDLSKINIAKDIYDEADSLKANKAIRVLEFYEENLPSGCVDFMKAFSIFSRSIPEPLVMETFNLDLGEKSITNQLDGHNLLDLISELKNRRLLVSESDSFLTCHPLVRDYFRNRTHKFEVELLHQASLKYFLRISPLAPSSLKECFYLFSACYHASKAGNTEQFHAIFYDRLNRGQKRYLGFGFAAWDESLSLASLSFPDENMSLEPFTRPSYYLGMIAYSLSRLYRNHESIPFYIRSIWTGLRDGNGKDKIEAAIQANCLLSTLMLMGEYHLASQFIDINVLTVLHIESESDRAWQMEHAMTTIGRLAVRIGDIKKGLQYYKKAAEARESGLYDVYQLHELERATYVDVLLHEVVHNHDQAELDAQEMMEIGEHSEFPDIISGANRALAKLYRVKAKEANNQEYLDKALEFSDQSLLVATKRSHYELEIQIRIERAWIFIQMFELGAIELVDLKEQGSSELALLNSAIMKSQLLMYLLELGVVSRKFGETIKDEQLIKESDLEIERLMMLKGDSPLSHFGISIESQDIRKLKKEIIIPEPSSLPATKNEKEIRDILSIRSREIQEKLDIALFLD